MKLQILVNHYQEPEALIARLLRSIEAQEAVSPDDFEILIYSDGHDHELSVEFLQSFNLFIRYRSLDHRGVCATRNALMDDATAEWLMFCDADDCFHSTLGLYRLLKATRDLDVDVIGSTYDREDLLADGSFEYMPMERDSIRVHGKIFRRSYLLENDIRFPDEMPFSGDMYFLWLAYNLKPNFAWMKDSFYVWKHNPDSVTRKHDCHRLRTYHVMMKNYTLLTENLIARGRLDLRDMLVGMVIQMMYLNDTNEQYMQGPAEYVDSTHEAMTGYLREYDSIYSELPLDFRKAMYDVSLTLHREGSNCTGFDGIEQWIDARLTASSPVCTQPPAPNPPQSPVSEAQPRRRTECPRSNANSSAIISRTPVHTRYPGQTVSSPTSPST